jgi:hypothetical protein
MKGRSLRCRYEADSPLTSWRRNIYIARAIAEAKRVSRLGMDGDNFQVVGTGQKLFEDLVFWRSLRKP